MKNGFRRMMIISALVLATGLAVSGPAGAVPRLRTAQPDLQYTYADSPLWMGNGFYRSYSPNGQEIGVSIPEPETGAMDIKVENDGRHPAAFQIRGDAHSTTFLATYSRGAEDITGAVVNGTYNTGILAPGEHIKIRLSVEVTCDAEKQESFAVWAKGVTVLGKTDVVGYIVTDSDPQGCNVKGD